MSTTEDEFLKFSKNLAANNSSYEDWIRFIHRNYDDPALEVARKRIFDICDKDESIGDEKWPLREEAISEIEAVIQNLQGYDS